MTGRRQHSHRSASAALNSSSSPVLRQRRQTSRRHVSVSTGGAGVSVSAVPGSTPLVSEHISENISEDPASDSHSSGANDARKWFDRSNQNPTLPQGSSAEDISPFYQKESDCSAADAARLDVLDAPSNPYTMAPPFLPPSITDTREQANLTDDYRSVIDDLTIENKRLKEELKRYRDNASRDVLENEKLFEIKMHGLPRRKKQELENTLRNFAASLDNSISSESTSRHMREKSASSKNKSNVAVHSSAGPSSKHASTSSHRSRPVDSAYASMSTGANSSGSALLRPSFGGPLARTSEQKVERYLQDIPEGLHPNYGFGVLSERDKKKLVVRRLEQLFTGKIGGRYARRNRAMPPPAMILVSEAAAAAAAAAAEDRFGTAGAAAGAAAGVGAGAIMPAPVSVAIATAPGTSVYSTQSGEPMREAQIQTQPVGQKSRESRDNMSLSNSNSNWDDAGNGTVTGTGNGNGNGNGNGSGNRSGSRSAGGNGNGNGNGNGAGNGNGNGRSPPEVTAPEQRPTRPRDLDPDRIQVPSENMEYIRHLGLVPPEIEPSNDAPIMDVSPDADGWVYLNLLSNLAQLHIFNVAPDFVRKAIVEKSTKFQLSPDGQKVRWRGGTEGTKFSSDSSSGDNSRQGQSTDEGDGSDENGKRKRRKTSGDGSGSGRSSSGKTGRSGPRASRTHSLFHYKPLFVREKLSPRTPDEPESDSSGNMDDSSHRAVTADNPDRELSRSDRSASATSSRRKRHRVEGVLVYYTGAPFCTDLAGDSSGGTSPATCGVLSEPGQNSTDSSSEVLQDRPLMYRSSSGARVKFRPLTDYGNLSREELARLGLASTTGLASSDEDSSMHSGDAASPVSVEALLGEDLVWYEDLDEARELGELYEAKEPQELLLEASGIGRVFPEDHFSVLVTTKRPFRRLEAGGYMGSANCEDDDRDDDSVGIPTREAFSMGSLMKRLGALKRQSVPISGAVPRLNQTSSAGAGIQYVSSEVRHRAPVPLPPPAMFYPLLSASSDEDEDEDSSRPMDDEDEDESMLSSSSEEMISRRANPQSDKNPSAPSPSQAMDLSGDASDVEAESMGVDSKDGM